VSLSQLGTSVKGGTSSGTQLPAQYELPCSLEPTGFCYLIEMYKLRSRERESLPSMRGSPKWPLSLRFPHQNLYLPLLVPIRATCPVHLILLDFITQTGMDEEYTSLSSSLCSFLYSHITSSLLDPDNLPNTLLSNTFTLRFSLSLRDQVSHPYKTTGKIIVLYTYAS
jgi:hypothetical protein